MTTIRPACADDLPAIYAMLAQLSRAHAAYDPARYVPPPDIIAVYEPWMHRAIRGEGVLAIVADEGAITGYLVGEAIAAQGEYWSPPHVYIHDLFVDPAHRAQGVANALLAHASHWATAQGIRQLRGIVRDTQRIRKAVFAKSGFRESAIEVTLDL